MIPIQPVLSALRATLRRCYGDRLVHLMLYGSWARGEATAESDIDVMVVLRGPVQPVQEIERMGDALTELLLAHDVVVSVYPISEESFYNRSSPLLNNIRQEGIAV